MDSGSADPAGAVSFIKEDRLHVEPCSHRCHSVCEAGFNSDRTRTQTESKNQSERISFVLLLDETISFMLARMYRPLTVHSVPLGAFLCCLASSTETAVMIVLVKLSMNEKSVEESLVR